MDNVLDSAKFIAENADNVKIEISKVKEFSTHFIVQPESNWLDNSPFDIESLNDEEKLMFCVVFNALSFSYWGDPYWNVEYLGVLHTRGSWSLVAAIFRSIAEDNSLLDTRNLLNTEITDLKRILRGNTEIPLLNERLAILNRIGFVLTNQFEGRFSRFIESSNFETEKVVSNIIKYFNPAFDDHYLYKGQSVLFNKRAQALVESVHSVFKGNNYGNLNGIQNLTALADYIIPNLLRSLGILEYSEELSKVIDSKFIIQKGSSYEIEIRGNTIWVVELIRRELTLQKNTITSKAINDYLWTIGGDVKTPYHLTRTTAY